MYGPFGAFMPENLAAFAAGLNPASMLNALAASQNNNFANRPGQPPSVQHPSNPAVALNELYSSMRMPQSTVNPMLTITSPNAAASGNMFERNGAKQHYSFHCDSYEPSPNVNTLQPFTFPTDAFDSPGCPRRTRILSHLIHGDVVCAVTISDQNKQIYTGGKGCVKIWDLKESINQMAAGQVNGRASPLTISKPLGQFECLVSRFAHSTMVT